MPKQKTKRAAMKRFKTTGSGKLKRWHANHSHILTKKTRKRNAYRERRKKKSEFRALWITRINAAARSQGMSYSRFMAGLRKAGVDVNRKVLADLAVHDSEAFARIAELARGADAQ